MRAPARAEAPRQAPAAPARRPVSEWPEVRIEPHAGRVRLELGELWRHRTLVGLLAWREVRVRYKQTLIGAAWTLVQPLLTLAVFTVLFGRMMRVPTEGAAYPLFALSALVPWTYFVHALTQSTMSLVNHHALVTRVYFPRLALPLAAALSGLVDLGIAFLLLLALMAWFGAAPTAAVLALPVFLLWIVAAALGMGLWLSAVNVQYRDVANVLPFLIQILLFVTPVAYPSALVPEQWRAAFALNPLAGAIEGFRWSLLAGTPAPDPGFLALSAASTAAILLAGLVFFRHREDRFADLI